MFIKLFKILLNRDNSRLDNTIDDEGINHGLMSKVQRERLKQLRIKYKSISVNAET